MWQLIAVAAAFVFLPVLVQKFKLSFGLAMPIVGILMSLFTLTPPASVFNSLLSVFTTFRSAHIIICVMLIGVLGNLLKHYGFLQQIVEILKRLLHSRKKLICIIPSVLGLLAVPGGAYLSAPFVDELGKEMNITPSKRVAINMAYRHALVTVYPLSIMLLYLAALLPDTISLYSVIALNAGYVVVMVVASYFLYLPRGKELRTITDEIDKEKSAKTFSGNLKSLAFYTMPIYLVVILTLIPGIHAAMALAMSVVLIYLLCNDRKDFFKVLLKGININMMITVTALFFVQNTIANLDQFNEFFLNMFAYSSVSATLLALAVGCFVVSIFTSLAFISMSIFVPIVLTLPLGNMEMLVYVFFAWTWAYMGYYFSMGHLCQILSIQSIKGSKLSEVYIEHLKLFPFLAAASVLLFFLYTFILVR